MNLDNSISTGCKDEEASSMENDSKSLSVSFSYHWPRGSNWPLPPFLTAHVLSFVSTDSVLRFRLVCKNWKLLVSKVHTIVTLPSKFSEEVSESQWKSNPFEICR